MTSNMMQSKEQHMTPEQFIYSIVLCSPGVVSQ